jgi:hypothetical protein
VTTKAVAVVSVAVIVKEVPSAYCSATEVGVAESDTSVDHIHRDTGARTWWREEIIEGQPPLI